MTDAVLARVAELDLVTRLNLGGSRELTDDGLLHLARMPQLEHLDLNETRGKLTDRGLEVLRHLPNLAHFEMTWQGGISDAGVANLRFCDQLETVNLMGSPTGDGAIEALQGKPRLRRFSSGRLVTDRGLPLLHNFPLLKTWHGPSGVEDSRSPTTWPPPHRWSPSPTTGSLAWRDSRAWGGLDLFWHVSGLTSDGFAPLVHLPNLGSSAVTAS